MKVASTQFRAIACSREGAAFPAAQPQRTCMVRSLTNSAGSFVYVPPQRPSRFFEVAT